jgi:hypothetical protein
MLKIRQKVVCDHFRFYPVEVVISPGAIGAACFKPNKHRTYDNLHRIPHHRKPDH